VAHVGHIPASRPSLGVAEERAVARVLASGRLAGNGPEVEAFERQCAEWLGVEETVAVSSGTAALFLALSQYVRPGDRVVTSPLTFYATVEAILELGGTPVFADVNERGQMHPASAIELMRTTPKVAAVCPVHMYGDMVSVLPFADMAMKMGIGVVEDACQAHGAMDCGAYAGTLGDYGCLSFYATKHITTLGEGGLVICNKPDQAARIRAMRSHGMTDYHTHLMSGWNWRMPEAAAAVGRAQLARFPAIQERRRRQSNLIWDQIDDLPWLTTMRPDEGISHGFFWLPILLAEDVDRNAFAVHVQRHGVEIRHRYSEPVYHQPALVRAMGQGYVEEQQRRCPTAEALAPRIVGLPTCSQMTNDEAGRIVEAVRTFTP